MSLDNVLAVAGPDALWLATPVPLTGRGMAHQATFTVTAGDDDFALPLLQPVAAIATATVIATGLAIQGIARRTTPPPGDVCQNAA